MISKFVFISALCLIASSFAEEDSLTPKEVKLSSPKARMKSPTVKAAFSPFTGKIIGEKVRVRLQPDLDGLIVEELSNNEYVSIIDQDNDFYVIAPPENLKAYIFRSFVLDGVVEGNRVNVRLEPDLEAPVIGHFNSGDKVEGVISAKNKKWLEITPPPTTRFYIAKEYVEYAGGPDLKKEMANRKETLSQLMEAADLFSKTELEKSFEEIDFEKIKQGYMTIINDYSDFPNKTHAAKDALAKVHEEYLQKRIDYLENKAALTPMTPSAKESSSSQITPSGVRTLVKMWEPIEEGLFASWAMQNEGKSIEDFYDEQRIAAVTLTGILESFKSPVQNKPGDFIVKDKNLPIAYVYSTKVNLKDFEGKKVTLVGAPRSNNHFAFPAYFVLEVE